MSSVNEASGDGPDFLNTAPTFDFSDPKIVHDRILVVGEKKFHVSSGYLSIWSEYFRGLFQFDSKDLKMGEFQIQEVAAEDFEKFLMFIYPPSTKVTEDNLVALIKMAHRFLVPGVMVDCNAFVKENFDIMKCDIFELLEVAIQFEIKDLKDKIGHYILASPEETMNIYRCVDCRFINKSVFCAHTSSENTSTIYANTFILNNKDGIATLSNEAQSFILQALVHNFK